MTLAHAIAAFFHGHTAESASVYGLYAFSAFRHRQRAFSLELRNAITGERFTLGSYTPAEQLTACTEAWQAITKERERLHANTHTKPHRKKKPARGQRRVGAAIAGGRTARRKPQRRHAR